ncbi:putative Ig domain-containing protein [Ereboglobus luteus]|uniref:Pectate lyase n=1 Tax=Ereboglobus luteus TaxID=1796921 RepID=A0A2U8E3N6_9BACT|nr:putative Ig domain-containing protein [Ereboglobus luteus]AWI09507.1 hypothetical protein CKA38_09860 [Ereboglobus luteus]
MHTTTTPTRIVRIATLAVAFAASFATLRAAPAPTIPSSAYNLTGFAATTTGGGVINDTDAAYRKVTTALEFITAIRDSNKTAGAVKVIEVMNDLNLGWNEIGSEAQNLDSNPARAHAAPKLHPTLITSGVTLLDIKTKGGGLTIFSANGATIKHCTFNIKNTSNIIIRNLKFDEMWEWDEATKGDYDSNDWDFITLGNGGDTTNIWIDHCTFTSAYDGITDMKAKASNVTYSWCRITGSDDAPGGFIRAQLDVLEASKSSHPMYNTLRTKAGFTIEEIAFITRGAKKGILMGANSLKAENANLTATFHHILMTNLWDRAIPRLRGGNVHIYNVILDDTEALAAKRLRDTRAAALDSAGLSALNKYKFNPPLNGAISTEDGAILLEKSIYTDCLWPLRNNQTDPSNAAYTGKILGLDVIYNFDSTTIRGNSTDDGNPLGPFQSAIKPFSWSFADNSQTLPYTIDNMDDPSVLPVILEAGAGAGVIEWADTDGKYNWLKTTYPAAPASDIAPVITLQPKSQSVIEGSSVTLSVSAIASPAPSYQWYKDSLPVAGGTTSTLTIASASAASVGAYYAVVTNGIAPDATSATATISLTSPPAAPVAAAATGITGEGFTANWALSANATGYSIDVSPDPTFANCWPGYENLAVGNVASHAITGLSPATTYYYRVRATVGSYSTADSNAIAAATAAVANIPAEVDDPMDDTDRLSAPSLTNTRWVVANSASYSQLAATTGGITWTLASANGTLAVGYFPKVTVPVGETLTATLEFTPGTAGATADGFRFAFLSSGSDGILSNDVTSGTNDVFKTHTGYALFSKSGNVGGGSTAALAVDAYRRNDSPGTPADLLSKSGDWTKQSSSSGASGNLVAGSTYKLVFQVLNNGSSLTVTESLTGPGLSNVSASFTDNAPAANYFDAIALRFAKGSNQFGSITLNSLKVTGGVVETAVDPLPAIYSAPTASGAQGAAFNYACVSTNGATSYSATGLPSGLSINASTGVISGTPAEYGSFDAIVTASNANGAGADFTLTLTIEPEPAAAPVAAEATARTAEGFTANWTAVPGATSYQLDIATDSGFTTMVAGYEELNVGDVTSYAVTGLDAATTYYYRVSAVTESVVGNASATITVVTAGEGGGYLVNDSFTDADRIGGTDGSSTHKTNGPFVATPSSANTQWVANQVSTLVATGTGLVWGYTGTSSATALGYFPDVTVQSGVPMTIALTFTTGTTGGTVNNIPNNLRIGLINDTASGRANNDGISSTDARFEGDTGYAVFSASSVVGGGSTADIGLKTYKRTPTDDKKTDLINTDVNWTSLGASTGATGNLGVNTSYTLTFTLNYNGSKMTINTKLAGGDLAGFDYTVEDETSPVLTFNTIAFRLGKGVGQFSEINFTNLKIWEGAEPASGPAAPTLAEPNSITAEGFTANWNTAAGATGYYLDVSTDPDFGSFVSGYENLYVGNNLSHAITGLTAGVTYYYRVRAANADGTSASTGASTAVVTTGGGGNTYLVNDSFTDYDRIGGFDGSATAPDAPLVGTPTATNTQWVASSTNTLVATGTGMVWNYAGTGNSMTIGYFPEVTVANSGTVTVQLKFTTGVVGTGTNNLRIALINDTPNGRFETDGVSSASDYYKGDTGYAIMSAASNIGNATANLVLRTYKHINLETTDLLGTAGNWGTATGTTSQIGNSSGSTGYFQGETDYTLTLTLAKNTSGTEMTIGTKLEGGNFTGLEYSVVDRDTTVAIPGSFNALAFRLGGSTTQFDHLKFTSLKVWEGDEPAPVAAAPVITCPATASATQGAAFTYNITAINSPTSYALASGALPAGVTLNTSTGVISGTPTESGTFNVTLTATNDIGASAPHSLAITVATAITEPPVINSETTATAVIGAAFTYTITATNEPSSFAATGLPASGNLQLDTATGVISGTAAVGDLGTHTVVLTATNAIGASAPVTLTLTVELPPALSAPVALPATGETTTGFIARWEAVTGADSYRLDVATDAGFTSLVSGYGDLNIGTMTGRMVTGLSADTDYYYRVRAVNEAGPSASSNTGAARTASSEVVLVDDSFNDTDRIGGFDGTSTSSSSPAINTPTSANTQWVIGNAGQLIATTGGMNWNFLVTNAVSALGYFPTVNVANGTTVTLRLKFTTGTLGGATSGNNFRIVMIDSSPNGYRQTDGAGSTADPFIGDKGYAFFMPSPVAGASTMPVTLQSFKRTALTSDNLFGSDASWTRSNSVTQADGHRFASNTAYTLTITLTRSSATSITTNAVITGGNFDNLICEIADADTPVTKFDTLGLRFGAGINQFNQITLNSLRITTTGSSEVTEPPVITSALTASATRGAAFSYTIVADNVPTSFTAEGLPSGLELETSTGVISGTPTATGSYAVTIGAHNAIGSDTRELIITVTAGGSDITTIVPPSGGLTSPASTVFDAAGNAYIADIAAGAIMKVAGDGTVTTFATIPQLAVVAADSSGNLYAAGNDGNVTKILADGTVVSPALATGVTTPGGIAVDSDGNVYVSKTASNTIVKITPAGAVSTLAGSGSAGSADATGDAASFNGPTGLALNGNTGTLYVADTVNCTIRAIDLATGTVTTVAGRAGVAGDIGSEGSDGKATDGTLDTPEAITIDAAGLLYIADTGNNLIRGFDPVSGALTTLAGDSGSITLVAPAGLAFNPVSGLLNVADTGNGALRAVTIKPVIAAQIVDRIAKLGTTVTLDGTAWASPAASYQWSVHGTALAGSEATITINVKSVTDSGVYTIAASNTAGESTAGMRLTVTGNDSTQGPNDNSPNMNDSGGGGGAPSLWILGAMALLALVRKFSARRMPAKLLPLLVFLSFLAIHTSPFAIAQQATPSAELPPDDEIITMSAFEVTGQSIKGYTASESVTGTRVASLLRDLPFNVNVVTDEFIADFNAFDLADQLSNVSSFSPSENIGQFQLRGFEASTQLVDGFRRVGLTGVTVTDRVEVIKGPAASIYGAIQPGGAVNTLRKKPAAKPKYGLTLGVGTHDQARASFYATGPVGNSKKLFYRLDTEYRRTERQQEFTRTRNGYAALQLAYKPTSRTTLSVFIDHADRHDHPVSQLATSAARVDIGNLPSWFPYDTSDLRRTWAKYFTQYFAQDFDYYDMNFYGPTAAKYSRLTSGSVTLDHKVNSLWSIRASFNMSTNLSHTENANIGYYPFGYGVINAATTEPPTAEVRITPKHAETTNKATGFQLDNLFRFDTGPIKHQLLVTGDYYRNSSREFSATWSNAFFYDPADPYNLAGNPSYASWDYATWDDDRSPYNRVGDNSKVINRNYGLFVSERATMFKGRLIAMAGVRYDYVDCTATHMPTDDNYTTKVVDYSPDSWTYQLGLTAVINRNITAYVNASSAFDPQPQLDEYDNPLPNKESDGYEFGFKFTLFSEALNITLNRFYIRQENLTYSVNDPETGQKETIVTGEQKAKGYEIDFNWQLTRSLNIIGGYGYVDAEITDAGKLNWLNNTTPRRVPKHNLGISVRYEFVSGPLKGLFATGGATYYSKSLVNAGSGYNITPYKGTEDFNRMSQELIYNVRFPNGGLPYPYLPENAIVSYFTPASGSTPAMLYWTDNQGATTVDELKKYSYASPYLNGAVYVIDGRTQIYNRSSVVWKMGVGYKFKARGFGKKLSHKIQVNMNNVFNEKSTIGGGIPILERNVMVTYSVTF